MRGKIVIGNWKMNGSLASNEILLRGVIAGLASSTAQVAVCVPFPYLSQVQSILQHTPVTWGAQSLSQHASGAYTGEVSAAMLGDFACRYVLVGHSERRSLYAEGNQLVAEKFKVALAAGLIPVLCVGETLQERDAGEAETVVAEQLDAVIGLVGINALASSIVAYEPVWAIGTGRNATPEQAQAMHEFIRRRIASKDAGVAAGLQVLYGGSVKAGNAQALFNMPDIDGGLVGGAALVLDEFIAVCKAAQH